MARREAKEDGRHSPDPRPEFVALGLLADGPAHGYELIRRFRESLGGLWHISESQFYATLKRLEARGLVVASAPEKGAGANRRLLTLRPEGLELLMRWIVEPTNASPKLLHMEFLTRLYFARSLGPPRIESLVAAQEACLKEDIERLGRLSKDQGIGGLAALSAKFREGQLRAALEWILDLELAAIE